MNITMQTRSNDTIEVTEVREEHAAILGDVFVRLGYNTGVYLSRAEAETLHFELNAVLEALSADPADLEGWNEKA